MRRLDGLLRALILISATFLVTEWVHYRLEVPPLFQYLLGTATDPATGSAAKEGDSATVTESEFQTYLRVLEAMQVDRSLSIEAAVDREHVPLAKFRELEQRVQRNEALVDRARHILRERAESLWNARVAPRDHG
ncbi:MAG TPA: hypothetical protein VLF14_01190 [Candidatus Binatia bacterium]|nr:hypothetical protein [Candidatus Binatia bacterium]